MSVLRGSADAHRRISSLSTLVTVASNADGAERIAVLEALLVSINELGARIEIMIEVETPSEVVNNKVVDGYGTTIFNNVTQSS